jgi:Icc-related predicted phosphoesterase
MKILAIGDPHGSLEKVKKIPINNVDLILLTGDLGSANLARKIAFDRIKRAKEGLPEKEVSASQKKKSFMEAYNSTMKLIKYLSKKAPVMTIYGNVESSNAETKKMAKKYKIKLPLLTDSLKATKDVKIINNRKANFHGVKIGGLNYFVDPSWVKDFKPKNYKESMKSAKKQTEKAKKALKWFDKLDILVMHQPPYKVLDLVGAPAPMHWRGKNAGSKVLLDYIKRKQPKYVFCGHIHEGEGKKKVGKTEVYNLGVAGHKIIEI